MFKLRKVYHFKGKISDFKFHGITTSQKVGTRPCLPLCGIPLSFYNSLQTSGDWGDKLLKFRNRMLSHSCLIQASSCSTVLGLLCRIFLLWCAKCFLWVKDLDCRLAISVPGSFYAAMMFVIDAVCGLALSCWKCKVFPERDDVWMGAYVVLELGYTFQHWWCLSRCVSCPCHTHSCNPIPSEMQASELSADNNLGCPCPL